MKSTMVNKTLDVSDIPNEIRDLYIQCRITALLCLTENQWHEDFTDYSKASVILKQYRNLVTRGIPVPKELSRRDEIVEAKRFPTMMSWDNYRTSHRQKVYRHPQYREKCTNHMRKFFFYNSGVSVQVRSIRPQLRISILLYHSIESWQQARGGMFNLFRSTYWYKTSSLKSGVKTVGDFDERDFLVDAARYDTPLDWEVNSNKAYQAAIKNPVLFQKCCRHMNDANLASMIKPSFKIEDRISALLCHSIEEFKSTFPDIAKQPNVTIPQLNGLTAGLLELHQFEDRDLMISAMKYNCISDWILGSPLIAERAFRKGLSIDRLNTFYSDLQKKRELSALPQPMKDLYTQCRITALLCMTQFQWRKDFANYHYASIQLGKERRFVLNDIPRKRDVTSDDIVVDANRFSSSKAMRLFYELSKKTTNRKSTLIDSTNHMNSTLYNGVLGVDDYLEIKKQIRISLLLFHSIESWKRERRDMYRLLESDFSDFEFWRAATSGIPKVEDFDERDFLVDAARFSSKSDWLLYSNEAYQAAVIEPVLFEKCCSNMKVTNHSLSYRSSVDIQHRISALLCHSVYQFQSEYPELAKRLNSAVPQLNPLVDGLLELHQFEQRDYLIDAGRFNNAMDWVLGSGLVAERASRRTDTLKKCVSIYKTGRAVNAYPFMTREELDQFMEFRVTVLLCQSTEQWYRLYPELAQLSLQLDSNLRPKVTAGVPKISSFNERDFKVDASRYRSQDEWRKNSYAIYVLARKQKSRFLKCISHMEPKHRFPDDISEPREVYIQCRISALLCHSLSQWYEDYPNFVARFSELDRTQFNVVKGMKKVPQFDERDFIVDAVRFSSASEWQNFSNTAHKAARQNPELFARCGDMLVGKDNGRVRANRKSRTKQLRTA